MTTSIFLAFEITNSSSKRAVTISAILLAAPEAMVAGEFLLFDIDSCPTDSLKGNYSKWLFSLQHSTIRTVKLEE